MGDSPRARAVPPAPQHPGVPRGPSLLRGRLGWVSSSPDVQGDGWAAIGPQGMLSVPKARYRSPRDATGPSQGYHWSPSQGRFAPSHPGKELAPSTGGSGGAGSLPHPLTRCSAPAPNAPGNFGVHPSFPWLPSQVSPKAVCCPHPEPRGSHPSPPQLCAGITAPGLPLCQTPPIPQPTHHLHPRCQRRGGNLQTMGTPPHPCPNPITGDGTEVVAAQGAQGGDATPGKKPRWFVMQR